jgi:predicted O-linked N-acetylglucosamine transferase (SPINDLY family)
MTALSNYLFSSQYDPRLTREEVLSAHRRYGRRYGAASARGHDNDPHPERRLKLGFLSPDLGRHPVGYFLAPLLPALDPERLEVVCYSDRTAEDDLTHAIAQASAAFHRTYGIADPDLDRRIRQDRIDILFDLAGHTAHNRLPLFARKPAPIQVSWLGYFDTTGLPAMDYLLSDRWEVPPGEERWFTETVIRLPTGRFVYQPPPYAPDPLPPPQDRPLTFGCFNQLAKLTPEVAALWARLLHRLPESRLKLKWASLADPYVADLLRSRFADLGIDPGRLTLSPASPHPEMLAEYAEVDVALDPFPFSGCLTTLEALWMGVPVVALNGTRAVGRQSAAILARLGRPDLVAASPERYLDIAQDLARNAPRRLELRRNLRTRLSASPLMNANALAQDLLSACHAIWQSFVAATASDSP